MKATSIESEVTNFARLVTNAATPERWRSWALDRIRLSAGKTNDSLLFEGVSVGREELAEFVPEQDALVAVAVIQGGTANCHLKLCWGGHETFYGIMIGTEAFRPANGNRILVDLAPGFYAYLMK